VVLDVKFNKSTDEAGDWQYAWELLQGTGFGFVEEFDKRQLVITDVCSLRIFPH
jgi:hypothetical protein